MKPYYQQQSPLDEETPFQYLGRRIFTKGFLLGSLVFAIACAAFLILGESGKEDNLGAHAWGGSVSPYSPGQQANAIPHAADARLQVATPPPRVAPPFKDVPDSLHTARANLDQRNLADAKAANDAALAHDANNLDARDIQRDIAAREQRRDSALRGAELCATQGAWGCVQRQASEALAIDSSSARAQSLMEQAIIATAWKPLARANPPHGAEHATAAVPLPRGGAKAAPLPSSRDWDEQDADRPPASQDWSESAPPLPGARTHANPTNLAHANPGTATAAADQSDVSHTAVPASSDNDLDPRERAILQSGWKHSVPSGTAP
ncbi:MAG TPA: hypothetical protein VGG24_12250 [Paraburkholderia sp.]